jgi:SAM-dependent methyltransferase
MVNVASGRLSQFSNVAVTALDRTSLAMIPDASMDAAYCVAVFIHMDKEDWFIYLTEMARILKPGGRIYFDHWNLAHPVGWRRWLMEVQEYRQNGQGQRKDVARNQFTTPQEAHALTTQAGFDVAQVLTDSPWVQVMAVKPGGLTAAAVAAQVAARQPAIAYSARWSVYFNRVIDILMRGEHPRAFVAELARESDEESAMYHAWIIGIWKQQTARWGECAV